MIKIVAVKGTLAHYIITLLVSLVAICIFWVLMHQFAVFNNNNNRYEVINSNSRIDAK